MPSKLLARTLRASMAAAALVAALGSDARAQNAPDQAAARSLFDEGARLYATGDYPAACAKLEASYHLFAGIGTRGKLAECYEKVGRTASAWAMYREVVALASKAGDATRQKVAGDRAAALEPKLSHLTVTLPPASDVPGLTVRRGNDVVEKGAMDTPVPIDPGPIAFAISAPGRVEQTVNVNVDPGATVTFSVPQLELVPAPPPAATTALVATSSADETDQTASRPWQRPVALAVGGVGVITAAVGGILALTAKSSYQNAFSSGHCDHATLTCDATGQGQTNGARSQANVGGALFGVGLVLAAGGGALFFTAPHATTTSAGPAAAARLVPDLAPGHAGFSFEGVFP